MLYLFYFNKTFQLINEKQEGRGIWQIESLENWMADDCSKRSFYSKNFTLVFLLKRLRKRNARYVAWKLVGISVFDVDHNRRLCHLQPWCTIRLTGCIVILQNNENKSFISPHYTAIIVHMPFTIDSERYLMKNFWSIKYEEWHVVICNT